MAANNPVPVRWKIHTGKLLGEILNNPGTGILTRPLQLLARTLTEIGERASQLNDPILNDLMCRLTIYEIADPDSPDYDPKRVEQIAEQAEQARRS